MFEIYTIELSETLDKHNAKYKLYADDIQVYFPFAAFDEAMEKTDAIMKDIKTWMISKKLKLNEDKTKCMIYGSMNALKNHEHLENIKIGSFIIQIKNEV